MLGTVEGRRRRGRPPMRWIDEIATRCGGVGAANRLAQDRAAWSRFAWTAAASDG